MTRELSHEKNRVHFLVTLRMCLLWHVYKTHTKSIPTKFTFPYYMGIVMDLHVPAFHLGPFTTLQEIYAKNMAPECIYLNQIEHDEHSRIDPSVLESHWVAYLCHAPLSKCEGDCHANNFKPRKRSNVRGTQNSLIKAQQRARKPASRQDHKSLNELLTKGQPNQTVVRYVQKAFIKGLVKSPETNPVVITMTKM